MSFEKYADDLCYATVFPEGKLFRITFDPLVRKLKLLSKNYDVLEQIRHDFSVENPTSFFVSRYGYKAEDRHYQIVKFGYFAPGLVFEVMEWILTNFGSLDRLAISKNCLAYLDEQLMPLKRYIGKLKDRKIQDIANIADDVGRNTELRNNGKNVYEFRDYQRNSIDFLLNKGYGRGLIEIPTAGGNSFILANFIWNLLKHVDRNYKTLILVPNKQLVEQFYKDLLDYGFSKYELTKFTAGLKGANAFNPDAKITIANRQFVFKNKTKLPKVDVLICDEVHQCCASSTAEFIQDLNCQIKVGCSGTLPRDKNGRWQLIGMFGRVVYTEDIVKLQDEGFISKLKITSIKVIDKVVQADRNILFHTDSLRKYKPDEFGNSEIAFNEAHDAEHDYYAKHYKDLYSPVLGYLDTLDENILVLFDRIEVGQNLSEYAKEIMKTKDVFYIDGSVPVEEREKIRAKLESSGNNILFAEIAVFSTGINVKRLNHITFACNTKSFSRVLQAIGRTLRLHASKTEAHLVDIHFNFRYSQRHFKERLKIYSDMYKLSPHETIIYSI